MSRRYKGRSTPAPKPVAFRTFGAIRPLLHRFVLPVYGDPDAPALEIVCDTLEAALVARERIGEADRTEFATIRNGR
ncbi:MAG TPA: hypothetical protein VHT03_09755 [Rhizomicrobium sp.]|jgi:hypothetical protein|nr:hypothetical protein [Rhizomicrobium sp.]